MIESTARLTRAARELGFAVPAFNVVVDYSQRATEAPDVTGSGPAAR